MPHDFNIELFKQGDEEAYNYVYNQYYPPIYLVAFLMLQNEKEAEDQTQKAFIELLDRRHLFETENGINDFLFIVTRNACIDIIRKRNRLRMVANLFIPQNTHEYHSLYDYKLEGECRYRSITYQVLRCKVYQLYSKRMFNQVS
jgi:RNA polymerase sigma factor (sigma-70 family)